MFTHTTRPCGGAFHCNEGEVCREYWEVTISPLPNSKLPLSLQNSFILIKTFVGVRVQILGSPTSTTLCWQCWQPSSVLPSRAGWMFSTGWDPLNTLILPRYLTPVHIFSKVFIDLDWNVWLQMQDAQGQGYQWTFFTSLARWVFSYSSPFSLPISAFLPNPS